MKRTDARSAFAKTVAGLEPSDVRVSIVAAHPDDEIIGAGLLLGRLRDVHVAHATWGAPRSPSLVPLAFRQEQSNYAQTRRAEALRALAMAGVPPDNVECLAFVDQELALLLAALSRQLASHFARVQPDLVVTHSYEGGHPDHDSCAFACRTVIETMIELGETAPELVEMTSYHRGANGEFVTGRFLDSSPDDVLELSPSAKERERKSCMLAAHASQREVLAPFGTEIERFRFAPRHRFDRRPHPGPLHYETLGWPMSADRFCRLATDARLELKETGLGESGWAPRCSPY